MWTRALKPFQPAKTKSLHGADPELCIKLFARGLNFSGVKQRLISADREWMESFLQQGGLFTLFETLQSLGESEIAKIVDVIKILDCVGCIKAVMNSQIGLEYIIQSSEKFVNLMAEGK